MSIHADDEFNLKLALMSELDDVAPGDELAGLVIARHRKVRRLRFAGVCGLFVVFAGIGVPIGIASTSGGTPAKTALRLGEYTLTLPGEYHLADAGAAPCTAVPRPAHPGAEAAAVTSGVCIVMFLAPAGYTPPKGSATIINDHLAIAAAGLSRGKLDELVTSGLRPAA
ncbi:MAG TPA: hypothetical protein VFQ68_21910 [Streptosporangiaceae bacterium]|nr:hypothetical protein [Streptosporangiaceae bacterium]